MRSQRKMYKHRILFLSQILLQQWRGNFPYQQVKKAHKLQCAISFVHIPMVLCYNNPLNYTSDMNTCTIIVTIRFTSMLQLLTALPYVATYKCDSDLSILFRLPATEKVRRVFP